ncbi:Poly(A)-specific ribonuclease PARN [Porphyridium purpureum]|uniref:Poly(A)-specific ribonuclease PARN n=1 Tax=Porphyridium purpureum TaxID=35688 RepID=A0A5J4YMV6_PORPP|nr:Poly(A)-specific ribonuclease PARN [Porphyridium purpureum]|eukprot:POR9066..scf295_9
MTAVAESSRNPKGLGYGHIHAALYGSYSPAYARLPMEVTIENLSERLETFAAAIADENTVFVAIDTEFTGLGASGWSSQGDEEQTMSVLPQEAYAKIREDAKVFPIVQLGFCVAGVKDAVWYFQPYNVYVRPRSVYGQYQRKDGQPLLDRTFSLQDSSMAFLCRNGFDFSKWWNQGIGYLNRTEADSLRLKLAGKEARFDERVQDCPSVKREDMEPEELKLVTRIEAQVQNWLDADTLADTQGDGVAASSVSLSGSSRTRRHPFVLIDVPDRRGRQRRLCHELFRDRFPSLKVSYAGGMSIEPLAYKLERSDADDAEHEHRRKAEERRGKLEATIADAKGVSAFFEVLIKQKTLVVFHNGLLDMCKLMDQFVVDLPESLLDFKSMVHGFFPRVLDTKLTAELLKSNAMEQNALTRTRGTSLFMLCRALLRDLGEAFQLPKLSSGFDCFDMNILRASREDAAMDTHQAGFDAVLTGALLLLLLQHNGVSQPELQAQALVFADRVKAMKSFISKLPLARCVVASAIDLKTSTSDEDRCQESRRIVAIDSRPDRAFEFLDKAAIKQCFDHLPLIRQISYSGSRRVYVFLEPNRSQVPGESMMGAVDKAIQRLLRLSSSKEWRAWLLWGPEGMCLAPNDQDVSKKRMRVS